ncbi:MAG: hypothetical protein JWN49_242 [Parcubacteria group bacterium]|nr:hypothetical protein [Parcubacteria group bacterium]
MPLIASRFEKRLLSYRLFYHVNEHTANTRHFANLIGKAMGLSDYMLALVDVGSGHHDIDQKSELCMINGVLVRKRFSGVMEINSSAEASSFMEKSEFPFLPEDYVIVASSITVTFPGWSDEYGTVIQPRLTPCSHPVERAVALADLASAGMDPAGFVRGGILLFAENNVDILLALRDTKNPADLDIITQQDYDHRFLSWLRSQICFAEGRQAMIDEELKGLRPTQRDAVRTLFCRFRESIAAAEQEVLRAEKMSFDQKMAHLMQAVRLHSN